jgi:hypothetical protein
MVAFAASAFVLAQEPAPPRSTLGWLIEALGGSGLFIAFLAFLVFVGACLVVARGRRPETIASFAAFVPVPFLFGLGAMMKGTVASFMVVAEANIDLKTSEIAAGIGEALVPPLFGLGMMFPSYLVLGIGWLVRLMAPHPEDGRAAPPLLQTSARSA